MASIWARKELWALSAIVLTCAFLASPGFFSIDESIYYLGARAISEGGALGIDNNGFDQFQSEALRLRFLVDGPQGLASQYPAGSALVTSILLPALGGRAFMLLNAIAAVLTFFTMWKICVSQFNNVTVARTAVGLLVGATFWLEYAVGIWPHVITVYFCLQSYWLSLKHLSHDKNDVSNVILSGLFAGTAMLFRLDGALAIAAVGLILLLFSPKFVRSLFWFGTGVLPPVVLASGLNFLKFGSPNPFSYGKSGGNTDLAAYGAVFIALCIGLGVIALYRSVSWRISRKAAIAGIVIVAGVLVLIPVTSSWLLRCWQGFLALIVDIRNVEDHRLGIETKPNGIILFWGLVKKSLGQSAPWIGLAAILLTKGVEDRERRIFATLLIFIIVMAMPFIPLSWHGGGGSNMRYLLPALPPLCILCAKLLFDLWNSTSNASAYMAAGAWAGIGLCAGWTLTQPSGYAGVQQIASTYVFVATALVAIAAGYRWKLKSAASGLLIGLVGTGIAMSMIIAATDFIAASHRRATNYAIGMSLSGLPPKSLVIAFPEWAAYHLPGNGSIIAMRDSQTNQVDQQLISNALDAGYRVYITNFQFDPAHDLPPHVEATDTAVTYPDGGRMIELRRTPGSR